MIRIRQHLSLVLATAALATVQVTTALAAPPATPAAPAKPAPKEVALSGKVLETMDGGGYTYVLLKKGAEKLWVAIPLTKIKVGQEVTFVPGYEFKNFNSKALNRKFDRVIFSAGLDSSKVELSPAAINKIHKDMATQQGAAAPAAPAAKPAPAPAAPPAAAAQLSTIPGADSQPAKVKMKKVAKAKGPNAYTVAELYAKRLKLEKKPVVIRGRVTQISPRILKRNWIHIQDGSGSKSKKNYDVALTTQNLPKEGDVVTARGVLYNRIDVGSGYKYEILIQDAKIK